MPETETTEVQAAIADRERAIAVRDFEGAAEARDKVVALKEGFKERLLMLRTEKGWTQKDLAKKADVCPVSIVDWETGKHYPRRSLLDRLAVVFGVQVRYLENGGQRLSLVVKHKKDELSEAVKESADERFRRGLKKIGLSQEQVDAAVGVKDFKGENLLDLINLMGGYTDELAIGLMGEIKTINAKIRDPATPKEELEKLLKERSYLHLDIVAFTKLHQVGLLTSARVQKLWQDIRNGEKENEKRPNAVLDIGKPSDE